MVALLMAGRLSDRLQRRKPFVIRACGLMAIGMALFACFPSWQMVLVATVILGLGFGTYVSSDLALASQLLPEAKQHGKDIGLINTAIFLPMLIAPLLAEVTLGQGHSYPLLFGLIALGTILAAVLMVPIKQVR
jgi:MFS family permease